MTNNGYNIPKSIEKGVTLAMIDEFWKEHLREMDDLKQSVQNAVYEQKDPLLIYKFEAIDLFKILMSKINKDIISFLMKSGVHVTNNQGIKEGNLEQSEQNLKTSRESNIPQTNKPDKRNPQKTQPVSVEKEIGRNEKVSITNGSETREIKWKKAKPLIDSGEWTRI